MITKKLPKYIQPLHLASLETSLSGELPLTDFPRLKDFLSSEQGVVNITFQFGRDEGHVLYLKGSINTFLPLICQRCLGAVDYELALPVSLSPVLDPNTIKVLPSCYEPLLLDEDKILLAELVEEELLLNLPFAPKHEEGTCESSPHE